MKLKFATKMNIMIIAVILLLSIAIGLVVNQQITKGIEKFAVEKAKSDLHMALRYMDAEYPGEWNIQNGKLYKGDTLINDNHQLVDEIGDDTGDTVTVFQGDTRVATNVKKDGSRATGIQASAEVSETVLKEGKHYYGEANVAGHTYQTAYMPIKDGDNRVVGMLYMGASQKIIDGLLSQFLVKFLLVLAGMIAIAFAISYWFTRRIKIRLTVLSDALAKAGSGDLTVQVKDAAGDELSSLADSYNKMTGKLKEMMNEVAATSEHLASSSEELTASSEQTSQATETIAESIQSVANDAEHSTAGVKESSAALAEVSSGVQFIAEKASSISEVSTQTAKLAQDGGGYVHGTVEQMNEINRSVHESGTIIKSLDQRSKEIGEITNIITGIAEQTNLLALNAAIEAARAGEHGKGFAVVAEEVRKLAEQSHHSSTQITRLILEIQQEMETSNESIERVEDNVQGGLNIVHKTANNFKEILAFMESLAEQIEDMAATAEEVSASTEEVVTAVAGLAEVSSNTSMHSQNVAASAEQQLASMEEIAASASALSNRAEELQKLISQFKV
ncbi:methyl-accepting chemotaxis protein [Bacillus xiapuensis]|uniref:methyl-accepting chemotaxis protein n=1 Tax=Bacillus xiapuensis TaxID=2014075 RepID=UPI000C250B58|nr:methyl-accepting chemotaxis protein [Bacillus xiapuensis]